MKRRAVFAAVAVVLSLGATPLASQDGIDCQRCHGELELLRQYVESLQEARSLRVSSSMLQGSAHGQLECTECHSGFSRFPHGDQAITASCGSCHEAVAGAWETGLHGGSDGTEGVPCAACHGIHDVVPVDSLDAGPALAAMSETCVGCHETQRLPVEAHHQDHAGCYDCHDPHGTGSADDPESRIAPLNQPRTCGACHDSVATVWRGGIHARMLRQGEWEGGEPPPTCTACHGAHPVAGADDRGFAAIAIEKCAGCHEKAAETYRRSYHGKATELGSEAAATCAECHGAHDMLPGSDPASRVSDANLVATCGECHEHARPAFVEYDTHPEPMNRERNPAIFYSFWFMNTLLIGTLTVFGLHTLLWWVRISIDRRKEAGHEGGGDE
jgi:hypothetical protein